MVEKRRRRAAHGESNAPKKITVRPEKPKADRRARIAVARDKAFCFLL